MYINWRKKAHAERKNVRDVVYTCANQRMKKENKNLMRWLEITAQYHSHKFITDEKYYFESQRKKTQCELF